VHQTACTPSPSYDNPIVEIHTDGFNDITFKYKDGSMAHPNFKPIQNRSVSVFKVPEGQVAQISLYRGSSGECELSGFRMVDRRGNSLFRTFRSKHSDCEETISLEEGELIVGYRSWEKIHPYVIDRKTAWHHWFQFIIAKEVEVEVEESDNEEERKE